MFKESISGVAKYVLLISYFLLALLPFIWILINSIKTNSEIYRNPLGLPEKWMLTNYQNVWTNANIGTNFLNSAITSLSAVFICLLICAMASYVIAKVYPSLTLYTYFALGIMIPTQIILIPTFKMLMSLDLLNSRTGLIIEFIVAYIPITMFILIAFMKNIPGELEEAAFIDGCSWTRRFFSIIIPLSKPALSTAGILVFLFTWNEYTLPYILITDPGLKTLTLGIYGMKGEYASDFGMMSAGLAIIMIPVIISFILFQEQVIKGMADGAVKG